MHLLLPVLVYSSRVTEQNFPAPFFISIIFFISLFSVWKNNMIILLTFCTFCGSLHPLAENACLSCLLVEMVLKEILSTAASFATTLSSYSLVGLKQFSIVLVPAEHFFAFSKETCCFAFFVLRRVLCFRQRWFLIAL